VGGLTLRRNSGYGVEDGLMSSVRVLAVLYNDKALERTFSTLIVYCGIIVSSVGIQYLYGNSTLTIKAREEPTCSDSRYRDTSMGFVFPHGRFSMVVLGF
jgi:hypothetical protein